MSHSTWLLILGLGTMWTYFRFYRTHRCSFLFFFDLGERVHYLITCCVGSHIDLESRHQDVYDDNQVFFGARSRDPPPPPRTTTILLPNFRCEIRVFLRRGNGRVVDFRFSYLILGRSMGDLVECLGGL
jgi:hypothetical protein